VVTYNSDEEQIEALKNWWDENGNSLMLTVIVVLAGVFGYQAWEGRVQSQGEAASEIFEEFTAAATARVGDFVGADESTARFLMDSLIEEHEDSAYASLAAMQMAKLEVNKGNLEQAEKDLKWVVVHDADGELGALARLRLARVMAARGEVDGALELIENAEMGSYQSSYGEARGDFYMLQGKPAEAREAYQAALDALAEEGINPILQMKLDDIAVGDEQLVVSQIEDAAAEDTEAVPAQDSAEELLERNTVENPQDNLTQDIPPQDSPSPDTRSEG
jgi:predicted negative regulator of RcsB-dependent stress response